MNRNIPRILTLFVALSSCPVLAQTNDAPRPKQARHRFFIDSLEQVGKRHQHDSLGAFMMVRAAELWRELSPDTSVMQARRSIPFARPYPRLAVLSFSTLAINYYYRGDYDSALVNFGAAYKLAQEYENTRQMGEMKNNMANIRLEQGNYAAALELYREALKIHQLHNQQLPAAMTISNIAYVYREIGDYDKSLTELLISVRIYEQALNSKIPKETRFLLLEQLAAVNKEIGDTYKQLDNLPQARLYFTKNLKYFESKGYKNGIARSLRPLAGVNSAMGQTAEAKQQLSRALSLHEQAHDPTEIAGVKIELAELAEKTKDYQSAIIGYRQAATINRNIKNSRGQTDALLGLSQVLLSTKSFVKAASLLDSAKYLVVKLASKKQFAKYYKLRSQYAEGIGNTQLALADFKLSRVYQDSIFNADKNKAIANASVKYETEKKEAQNRLQAAQLRTQQQVIRRRNTQLVAGLLVAALLAGLAYLLYTRRRLRREVEFAQERQQLTQLRAQAVLEAEEGERRRIGSDLHDGVGQLLTVAKLNLHALGEELQLDTLGQQTMLQNALDVVNESFVEVRQISHNLMPNALIKRGLAQAVRDFLSKVAPDDRLKINLEVVGLDSGGRLAPTVENVLFRVIQELVQNIIKHAQASEMTLQLVRGPEELTVLVEDNGVGFDPAALDAETTGIGLKNIESRLAFLGGRAEFDSRPGHGTTVTLEVPA